MNYRTLLGSEDVNLLLDLLGDSVKLRLGASRLGLRLK